MAWMVSKNGLEDAVNGGNVRLGEDNVGYGELNRRCGGIVGRVGVVVVVAVVGSVLLLLLTLLLSLSC